jgi:peptidoglycan/xylan/chitin deacetylase (PgdA/CDA1 family)
LSPSGQPSDRELLKMNQIEQSPRTVDTHFSGLDQPAPPRQHWLRPLKPLLGWLIFRTGLYRLFFRNKGAVVLFHRVDDRFAGNPISCSVSTFRTFCRFFAQYFEVINLAELVRRLSSGESIARTLVINFDDGYLDNYTQAAPVLEELGLTATYFVATDFIGTDSTSVWDAKHQLRSEWMTWDQLRDLRARGFEIGAHTCSHPDLGTLEAGEAISEITRSRQVLQDELGEAIHLFSYPFGDFDQIRQETRQAVKQAGFICCASAYGGIVRPADDPFTLRRQPVSQDLESPWAFGFELVRTRR